MVEVVGGEGQSILVQAHENFSQIVSRHPENHSYRLALVKSLQNLGSHQADAGNLSGGIESLTRAIALSRQLCEEQRDDRQIQITLAQCLQTAASCQIQYKKEPDAIPLLKESVDLLIGIWNDDPNDAETAFRLAMGSSSLGKILTKPGSFPEAQVQLDRSRTLLEKLVDRYPSNVQYRAELSGVYHLLALLYLPLDRRQEGLNMYLASLNIKRQLVHENPSITQNQSGVAATLYMIGKYYIEYEPDFDLALKYFDESVQVSNSIILQNPGVPSFVIKQFMCRNLMAVASVKKGDRETAARIWKQLASDQAKFMVDYPEFHDMRFTQIDIIENLAKINRESKRHEEELKALNWLIEACFNGQGRDGQDQRVSAPLARAYIRLGQLNSAIGDWPQAVSNLELARKEYDHLLENNTANFSLLVDVATENCRIGGIYLAANEPENGLEMLRLGAARLKLAMEQQPDNSIVLGRLGQSLFEQARQLFMTAQFHECRSLLEDAITYQLAAIKQAPNWSSAWSVLELQMQLQIQVATNLHDRPLKLGVLELMRQVSRRDVRHSEIEHAILGLHGGHQPPDAATAMQMAQRCGNTHRYLEAVNCYQIALKLDPLLIHIHMDTIADDLAWMALLAREYPQPSAPLVCQPPEYIKLAVDVMIRQLNLWDKALAEGVADGPAILEQLHGWSEDPRLAILFAPAPHSQRSSEEDQLVTTFLTQYRQLLENN